MAAVRVIFEYENDEVRLVSRQRVDMVVPPPDAPGDDELRLGLWAEVRQADGTTLYRRALGHLLRPDVEVFSQDPARTVTRAQVDRPAGMFVLVLPEVEEADHVALVDTSPEAPAGPETTGPEATARLRTREVLRVPLGPTDEGTAS